MRRMLSCIKEIGIRQRKSTILKVGLGILLAVLITTSAAFISYSNNVNKGLADNLLRLHVIANSDSEKDQALKRDIRDVVISFMQEKLKDSRNLSQATHIINNNLDEIENLARDKIRESGSAYSVKTMLGMYPFPTKAYGDVALPAGNYQALRIVIGNGMGSNWWCVLFPPLCFVDVTHGTIPDSVKEDLRKSLTAEEYTLVTSADNEGDIPIKIKFKIVEILQDSKIKFSGFISKIFGPRK